MANDVDHDQTPRSEASDPGLHCLQRLISPITDGYYGNDKTINSWESLWPSLHQENIPI